ncbi:hypothetical protein ACJX0J_007340, partial [Zea mays]
LDLHYNSSNIWNNGKNGTLAVNPILTHEKDPAYFDTKIVMPAADVFHFCKIFVLVVAAKTCQIRAFYMICVLFVAAAKY